MQASDTPAQQAGGYDWLATWRHMYDVERAQGEAATEAAFGSGADCWSGMAARFAEVARGGAQPDAFMQWLLPQLRPADRIIDIGAGTGRYIPLLAAHTAEVIALEPSESMRNHMAARIAEERLTNVQLVPERFPTADLPICDVAISAHVVYGVREIGPFLEGMNRIARRLCALYLMVEHGSMFISEFWKEFHGAPRLPLPGALECMGALYQIGYPASFLAVHREGSTGYPDEAAALADVRVRLRLAPDPERDERILTRIRTTFLHNDDGRLYAPQRPAHAAILWWEPRKN